MRCAAAGTSGWRRAIPSSQASRGWALEATQSASRRPALRKAIAGTVVTCPWHGWQYQLKTGTLIQYPVAGVSKHETRIVGDEGQVRLTD